jgi:hypothetical protein
MLYEVQNEIPSIHQLESFVMTIDSHLLMVISKKNNKLVYKQWVKFNAKAAKTLLVTMKRSAKKQSTRTTKPQKNKVAALTKAPTKRTPPTIELEDNPRAMAKRAMARKSSDASASVPGAAAGSEEGPSAASARAPTSEEGPSAASARAPTQNADSSEGASSASGMAPPSCTTSAVDSDADLVKEVEFAYKCKGEAVIEVAGEVDCMICHLPIKADDLVVVNAAEKVRHEICMSVAAAVDFAGKVSPVPPLRAREIKKNKKAARAATAAAGKKPQLPGVSADAAVKRHDELMNLAKAMAKTGESNGDTWRVRYEPTKRGSWLNTRHAVVLRWASGTCKTHQFAFAEMEMGDEAFTEAFDKAVSQVVNLGKE